MLINQNCILILHKVSHDKTSKACARRRTYMLKHQTTRTNVDVFVGEALQVRRSEFKGGKIVYHVYLLVSSQKRMKLWNYFIHIIWCDCNLHLKLGRNDKMYASSKLQSIFLTKRYTRGAGDIRGNGVIPKSVISWVNTFISLVCNPV